MTAGGTGAKPFLIVAGCLVLAGAAGVAVLFYVGHRVKRAVVEKADSLAVELPRSSPGTTGGVSAPRPETCALLSRNEASRLLGEPVARVEGQTDTCSYYGPPGLSARLAKASAASTFRAVQTPGFGIAGTEAETAVDQLAKSLGGGREEAGGESPLLVLVVGSDGRTQMAALDAASGIFGGIFRASEAKGVKFTEEVPGLGDRALRVPKVGLNVLRGEIIVRVVPGPIPDADTKAIAVARAVLTKIS